MRLPKYLFHPGLLCALLLILGGCGSEYYMYKPGISQQQVEQDKYEPESGVET